MMDPKSIRLSNNMMDLKSLGLLTKKIDFELIGLNTMMDFLNHPLKSLVLLNEIGLFPTPCAN